MSDAFDYYPDTDTLIVRFRRAPQDIDIFEGANFTVVTGQLGDLVEVEIRDITRFVERLVAEGVPVNLENQAGADGVSRARGSRENDGSNSA